MKTILILVGTVAVSYFGYTYLVKKGYITDYVGNFLHPKKPVTPPIVPPATRKPVINNTFGKASNFKIPSVSNA